MAESLPGHRRKVVCGIRGGVGKSREWLVAATMVEKEGKVDKKPTLGKRAIFPPTLASYFLMLNA